MTAFDGKSHRLHRAAAARRAIAWVYIDVLAPEAFGTVIGVAIALRGEATVDAGKVFETPLELPAHLD